MTTTSILINKKWYIRRGRLSPTFEMDLHHDSRVLTNALPPYKTQVPPRPVQPRLTLSAARSAQSIGNIVRAQQWRPWLLIIKSRDAATPLLILRATAVSQLRPHRTTGVVVSPLVDRVFGSTESGSRNYGVMSWFQLAAGQRGSASKQRGH